MIEEKEKKSSPKKVFIATGAIIVMFVIAITITLVVLNKTVWDTSGNYMKYVTDKEYEKANDYYNETIKGKPDKEISTRDKVNAYVQVILSNYANDKKSYEEVKEELQGLSTLIPVPTLLENSFNKLEELLLSKTSFEKAKKLMEEKKYKEVITELNKVIQTDKNYIEAKELLKEASKLNKNLIMAEIQELADSEDYETAIKMAETLIEEIGADKEVNAKLQVIKKQRFEQIIAQAESLANEKKYDEAILKVTEAKVVLNTENERIDEIVAKYTELLPVNILTLEPVSTQGAKFVEKDSIKDFYGNIYETGLEIYGPIGNEEKDGRFGIYDNSAQYTRLKGKLIVTNSTSSETKNSGIFKVYADGILIYTQKMYQPDKPIDFDIDITGKQKIKLVFYGEKLENYYLSRSITMGLVDTYFVK